MKNMIYMRDPGTGRIAVKEFAADSQLSLLSIVDTIAMQVVQGYSNDTLVGDKFFPSVRVDKETGRFPAFGKEAFVLPGNIKRAVGEKVQRVETQSGYVTLSLSEYALGVQLENRERNEWAGSPDMLLNGKLMTVADKIALYREKLQMTLLTTYTNFASGNYFSGAAKKWATTGDPVTDMRELIFTVQKKIGKRPNKVWFSPSAWELAIHNESVLARIKYGGTSITPAQMTTKAMAELLNVSEVVVPYAVYGTGGDGGVKKTELTMGWLWESVNACTAGCAYVGSAGGIEPSFGYTWERKNSPVIESYYENQTKSQVWDYEHFFDPAITLNEAGGIYYSLA